MPRRPTSITPTGATTSPSWSLPCDVRQDPWGLLVGLLGQPVPTDRGLLLLGGWSVAMIHTCGMRGPIDVLWLDAHGRVLAIAHRFPPWRVSGWVWGTAAVLEAPPGWANQVGLRVGDCVSGLSN